MYLFIAELWHSLQSTICTEESAEKTPAAQIKYLNF